MDGTKYFCRHCGRELKTVMTDLRVSPLANSYIKPEDYAKKEGVYPLVVYVCDECLLCQLPEFETPEAIFRDYSYFSSYSSSWLLHAKKYCGEMKERFHIGGDSFVVEAASNDGYLLQNFVEDGIPCLGVEPARNVAEAARRKGVPTISEFFGSATGRMVARTYGKADLIAANNVLAHVPDINDFVLGVRETLKEEGVATFEFPHLMQLIKHKQFDTIYHEHFSYLSILALRRIFQKAGLRIFDIQELSTHGGSLRVFVCLDGSKWGEEPGVRRVTEAEIACGMDKPSTYTAFHESVMALKREVLAFFIEAKNQGKRIAGYGAPAKGNTLLNYCGIGTDFMDYTVDQSPFKQHTYLPGVRIPVFAPDKLKETKPDYVVILPWNLKDEIQREHGYINDWGGRFVTLVPQVEVLS